MRLVGLAGRVGLVGRAVAISTETVALTLSVFYTDGGAAKAGRVSLVGLSLSLSLLSFGRSSFFFLLSSFACIFVSFGLLACWACCA